MVHGQVAMRLMHLTFSIVSPQVIWTMCIFFSYTVFLRCECDCLNVVSHSHSCHSLKAKEAIDRTNVQMLNAKQLEAH